MTRLIKEPTARSMPPVSTVRVWPRLTSARPVDCSNTLAKLPKLRKRSLSTAPMASMSSRSAMTIRRPALLVNLRRKRAYLWAASATLLMTGAPSRHVPMGGERHDRGLIDGAAFEHAAHLAFAHDDDAVRHADDLRQIRGDHQDGEALI